MNEYVDEMVSKDIETAEIVIQGEGQTGYRSIEDGGIITVRVEGSFEVLPCYFLEVQIGVICYIWLVVKMPGAIKRVAVYRKDDDRQCYEGEYQDAAVCKRGFGV